MIKYGRENSQTKNELKAVQKKSIYGFSQTTSYSFCCIQFSHMQTTSASSVIVKPTSSLISPVCAESGNDSDYIEHFMMFSLLSADIRQMMQENCRFERILDEKSKEMENVKAKSAAREETLMLKLYSMLSHTQKAYLLWVNS